MFLHPVQPFADQRVHLAPLLSGKAVSGPVQHCQSSAGTVVQLLHGAGSTFSPTRIGTFKRRRGGHRPLRAAVVPNRH
jgi:hypothetical protein